MEYNGIIVTKDIKEFQDRIFEKCQKAFVSKGNDYSGADKDTFANIRLASHIGLVQNPAHSCLVRMMDKVMRLRMLTDNNIKQKVSDESLEDTLSDLINYATYVVMLDKERKEQSNTKIELDL